MYTIVSNMSADVGKPVWFTWLVTEGQVRGENAEVMLRIKLNQLQNDGHTIFSIMVKQ